MADDEDEDAPIVIDYGHRRGIGLVLRQEPPRAPPPPSFRGIVSNNTTATAAAGDISYARPFLSNEDNSRQLFTTGTGTGNDISVARSRSKHESSDEERKSVQIMYSDKDNDDVRYRKQERIPSTSSSSAGSSIRTRTPERKVREKSRSRSRESYDYDHYYIKQDDSDRQRRDSSSDRSHRSSAHRSRSPEKNHSSSRRRRRTRSRSRSRSRDRDRHRYYSKTPYERRTSTSSSSVRSVSPSSDSHRQDSLDRDKEKVKVTDINSRPNNQESNLAISQNKINLVHQSPTKIPIQTVIPTIVGGINTFTTAGTPDDLFNRTNSTTVSPSLNQNPRSTYGTTRKRRNSESLLDENSHIITITPLSQILPRLPVTPPPLSVPRPKQQPILIVPPLAKPSHIQSQQQQQQQTQVGPTNVVKQVHDPRLNRLNYRDNSDNNNNANRLNSTNTSNSNNNTKDNTNILQRVIDPRLLKLRPDQLSHVDKNKPNTSAKSSTPVLVPVLVPYKNSPEKIPPKKAKPLLVNLPIPIQPLPNASSLFGSISTTSSRSIRPQPPEAIIHKTSSTPITNIIPASESGSLTNAEKNKPVTASNSNAPEVVKGKGLIIRRKTIVKQPEIAPILIRTNPQPRPLPTGDPRARKDKESPLISPTSTSRIANERIAQNNNLKINEKLNQLIEKQRNNPDNIRKAKLIIENPSLPSEKDKERDKKKKNDESKKAKSSQNIVEKPKTSSSIQHEMEKRNEKSKRDEHKSSSNETRHSGNKNHESQNIVEKPKTSSSIQHEMEKKNKKSKSDEHETQHSGNNGKCKTVEASKSSHSKGNRVDKRKTSLDIENEKDISKQKSPTAEPSRQNDERRRASTSNETESKSKNKKSKKSKKSKKAKKSKESRDSESHPCLLEVITLSSDSESSDEEIYSNILTTKENVKSSNDATSTLPEKQIGSESTNVIEKPKSLKVQSKDPIKIIFPINKAINKSRNNSGSNKSEANSSKRIQRDNTLELSDFTPTTDVQINSTSSEVNNKIQDRSFKEKDSEFTTLDKSKSSSINKDPFNIEESSQVNGNLLRETTSEAQKSNLSTINEMNKEIGPPMKVNESTVEKTFVDKDQTDNSNQILSSTPVTLNNNTSSSTFYPVTEPILLVSENINKDKEVSSSLDKEINLASSNTYSLSETQTQKPISETSISSAIFEIEKNKSVNAASTLSASTIETPDEILTTDNSTIETPDEILTTDNSTIETPDEILTTDNDVLFSNREVENPPACGSCTENLLSTDNDVIVAVSPDHDKNKEVDKLIPQTSLNDGNQMPRSPINSQISQNEQHNEQISCNHITIVEESRGENSANDSISMDLETQDEEKNDKDEDRPAAASTVVLSSEDPKTQEINQDIRSNEILMTLEEQSSVDNFISDISNQDQHESDDDCADDSDDNDSDDDQSSDSDDDGDDPIDNETIPILEKSLSDLKKYYDDFDLKLQNNELDEEAKNDFLLEMQEKIHDFYFDVEDSLKELEDSDSDAETPDDLDDGTDLYLSTEEKSIYLILILFLRRLLNDDKYSVHIFFIRDLIHIFQRIIYFTSKSNMATALKNMNIIIENWITSIDKLKIPHFEQEFASISEDLCDFKDETPTSIIKIDFGMKKYTSPLRDLIDPNPNKLSTITEDVKNLLDDLSVIETLWEKYNIPDDISYHEEMSEIPPVIMTTATAAVPESETYENPSVSTLPVSEVCTSNVNTTEAPSYSNNLNADKEILNSNSRISSIRSNSECQGQQPQQMLQNNTLVQSINSHITNFNNSSNQNQVSVIAQLHTNSTVVSTLVVNSVQTPRPSTYIIPSSNSINQNLSIPNSMYPIQRSNEASLLQTQTLQNVVSSMPSPSQQQIRQALSETTVAPHHEASRFAPSTMANQNRIPSPSLPLSQPQQTQQYAARMNNLQASINRILINNLNQTSHVVPSSGINSNISRILSNSNTILTSTTDNGYQNQVTSSLLSPHQSLISANQISQQQNQIVINPQSQPEIRALLTKQQQRTIIRPQFQQQQRMQNYQHRQQLIIQSSSQPQQQQQILNQNQQQLERTQYQNQTQQQQQRNQMQPLHQQPIIQSQYLPLQQILPTNQPQQQQHRVVSTNSQGMNFPQHRLNINTNFPFASQRHQIPHASSLPISPNYNLNQLINGGPRTSAENRQFFIVRRMPQNHPLITPTKTNNPNLANLISNTTTTTNNNNNNNSHHSQISLQQRPHFNNPRTLITPNLNNILNSDILPLSTSVSNTTTSFSNSISSNNDQSRNQSIIDLRIDQREAEPPPQPSYDPLSL